MANLNAKVLICYHYALRYISFEKTSTINHLERYGYNYYETKKKMAKCFRDFQVFDLEIFIKILHNISKSFCLGFLQKHPLLAMIVETF